MARRKSATKRTIKADARYSSVSVAKFISTMMEQGKKSISTSIMYDAFDIIKGKGNDDPLAVYVKAMDNVKPVVEVKSRRVGGATYQVPVEIREERREALAIRWIIAAARARAGKTMSEKLSAEFLDAFNTTGSAFKKKEDTHKMAEANKAFAHYRW